MKEMTATQAPTIVDGVNIDELITPEVLEEYRGRGYWVSPKLFSSEQIAEMRQAQERMWNGEHDSEIQSQYGARAVEPGLAGRAPAVQRVLAQQCDRQGHHEPAIGLDRRALYGRGDGASVA